MRLLYVIAAVTALFAAPLGAEPLAQDNSGRQQDEQEALSIGDGIICNTLEQARRLVALRNEGREMDQALVAVNQEASDPTACGPALVAFQVAQQIDGNSLDGQPVSLVKIIITAISDGQQWSLVPSVEQYAIMAPNGIEI